MLRNRPTVEHLQAIKTIFKAAADSGSVLTEISRNCDTNRYTLTFKTAEGEVQAVAPLTRTETLIGLEVYYDHLAV